MLELDKLIGSAKLLYSYICLIVDVRCQGNQRLITGKVCLVPISVLLNLCDSLVEPHFLIIGRNICRVGKSPILMLAV